MLIAGGLLLAVSTIAWWKLVFSHPINVFDRMLSSSLATPSVFKQTSQSSEGQALDQTLALVTKPQARVSSKSVLRQTTAAETRVTTESIGTLEADYVRYTDIKTKQAGPDGKPIDFNNVLNVWGKSSQDSMAGGPQLFNQTLFGIVPIGDIAEPERSLLLRQITDTGVYKFDSKTVKRQTVNGRPVYSYQVSIRPMDYITMLKAFARSLGVAQLERIDPTQYKDDKPLSFSFDIDVLSGQLKKIDHADSKRVETYSSYGIRKNIPIPNTSISVDELQSRLQKLR